MAYIDKIYYRKDFKGTVIEDDNELDALIVRASNLIDQLTNMVIPLAGGIESYLSKYKNPAKSIIETAIKNAVASEIEYLYSIGGVFAANDGTQNGGDFRIGNFSYSNRKSTEKQSSIFSNDTRFSKSVYDYLESAGLLYRGVGLCT